MRHLLKNGLPVNIHNRHRALATGRYCLGAYKRAQTTFAAPKPVVLPPPQSVNIQIRDAAYVDAEDIGRINVEAWQATYRGIMPDPVLKLVTQDRFELRWEDLLIEDPEPGSFTLIAEDQEEGPVGFVRGGLGESKNQPKHADDLEWEIFAINVAPRFQRFSIGRELMLEAFARILLYGGNSCYSWVLKDNSRARFFFKNLDAMLVDQGLEKLGRAKLPKQAYGWYDLTELSITDEIAERLPYWDGEDSEETELLAMVPYEEGALEEPKTQNALIAAE